MQGIWNEWVKKSELDNSIWAFFKNDAHGFASSPSSSTMSNEMDETRRIAVWGAEKVAKLSPMVTSV